LTRDQEECISFLENTPAEVDKYQAESLRVANWIIRLS